MVKGIFFDLGGTLVSYHKVNRTHAKVLFTAAQQLSVGDDLERLKTAYARALSELTQDYAHKDYYLHRDFFRDTFVRCFEHLEVTMDPAVDAWYQREHSRQLQSCLALKPECHSALAALKAKGLYLSIASNIDDDMLAPIVEREQLAQHMNHWTSSEEAQSCKPHHRFFEVCLEKSGLAPQEVLFVGDSPEHDINGAHRLGMRTALVLNETGEPPLQSGKTAVAADHTIRSLLELTELV